MNKIVFKNKFNSSVTVTGTTENTNNITTSNTNTSTKTTVGTMGIVTNTTLGKGGIGTKDSKDTMDIKETPLGVKVVPFGGTVGPSTVTEEKKRIINIMNKNKLKRLCRECIGDFWSRVDNNEIPISNYFSSVTVSSVTVLGQTATNSTKDVTTSKDITGTAGASTVTEENSTTKIAAPKVLTTTRKGANFTAMECTRERELTTGMECTSGNTIDGKGKGATDTAGASTVTGTVLENNNIITMSVSDYSYKSTPFGDVYYSPRFQDEKYIYRYVILTKGVRNEAYRLLKQSKSYLLTEHQIIRELCIDLSPGWEHFMLFKNRLDELILRRKL